MSGSGILPTRQRRQVLLITDIGRDTDDVLALHVLSRFLEAGQTRLAGVVTSGCDSDKKAGIARGWLRQLGIKDSEVAVAYGRSRGVDKVVVPDRDIVLVCVYVCEDDCHDY